VCLDGGRFADSVLLTRVCGLVGWMRVCMCVVLLCGMVLQVFKCMEAVVEDDIVVGQYGASPPTHTHHHSAQRPLPSASGNPLPSFHPALVAHRSIPYVRVYVCACGCVCVCTGADGKKVGYAEDKGVKKETKTPTYVAVVVHINSERWKGVPILMNTGKALDTAKSELFVHFKPSRSILYPTPPSNSLQVKLGPTPCILQHVNIKSPGISDEPQSVSLQLVSESASALMAVPTAYERLVLDVLRGACHLFVSAEEVEAAWAVVDPIIHQLESTKSQPVIYQFGTKGPVNTNRLLHKYHIPHNVDTL
jgi:hypothetical protein